MTQSEPSLPTTGAFALPGFSRLQFSGEDWRSWLQGQVTQQLIPPRGSVSFCLCKPTGQLLSMGQLHEGGTMIVPSRTVPEILARVDQMVILEDVSACECPEPLFHVFGAESGPWEVNRVGVVGYDTTEPPLRLIENPALINFLQLRAGIPDFDQDADPKTLPPEFGPEFEARFIDYTKGCYTGQEVLQRIHSRGHTNQTWRVFRAHQPVAIGAEIHDASGRVGRVTRVAAWGQDLLLGGFVRNTCQEPLSCEGQLLSAPLAPARP